MTFERGTRFISTENPPAFDPSTLLKAGVVLELLLTKLRCQSRISSDDIRYQTMKSAPLNSWLTAFRLAKIT